MSSQIIVCPKCNTQNPSTSKFCASCGQALNSLPQPQQPIIVQNYDARTAASMKSYTGSAVLVFFLYWLFWIPGLIVNYIYLNEAKRMEKVAGQSLPGTGCLSAMLWLNIIGIVLTILVFCMVVVMGNLFYFTAPSAAPAVINTRIP